MNSNNLNTPRNSEWRSCFRHDLFQNKVGLISGGGTGIGRAIAFELATLGATVVIASRDKTKCQHTADEINRELSRCSTSSGYGKGIIVAGPSVNIRKDDEVRALIQFVIKNFKNLDFLINNAGGQFISPAEDISFRGMSAVVDTNLVGTFLMCREAYTQRMKEHGGSIVNITIGNRNGMPCMMHSGAARAAVENMTATLCTEWIESNVRINCVRPGIIYTDSGFENYGPAGEMFVDRLLPTIPARRFGSPQEVSSAVVWLLCEGASYVTGTVLAVDGAGSYTFLPLVEITDEAHLMPYYGTLPKKARL